MGMTGGEMVAEYLIAERVPYVFGIPGHGDMAAFDAFKDRRNDIEVIAPKHEQTAAHMADAYWRASGKPLATMTSIGPGSMNVATGLATAFVDSIPLIAFSGGPQTYMLGRGVLQELERQQDNQFPAAIQPIVKRNWDVQHVDLLADVLPRAFNTMLSGRPGPVHVELPMDVQAEETAMRVPDPDSRRPFRGRLRPDPDAVESAAERLLNAKRPVILAGGGCLTAEAAAELRAVAEFLGAAVIVTMMGKGVFPEDHPLAAEHTGSNGTMVGNHFSREADVILAVGTRFAEQTSSSYEPGASFSVPPTEIVHFDIDPTEIGKNYPTAVGAVCDARSGLADLLDCLRDRHGPKPIERPEYRAEIGEWRQRWREAIRERWTDKLSMSRVLHEIRQATPRETIAIASAGHPQIQAFQEFLSYEPRTWLSPGGYSTMGYTLPAAIGASLAQPDRPGGRLRRRRRPAADDPGAGARLRAGRADRDRLPQQHRLALDPRLPARHVRRGPGLLGRVPLAPRRRADADRLHRDRQGIQLRGVQGAKRPAKSGRRCRGRCPPAGRAWSSSCSRASRRTPRGSTSATGTCPVPVPGRLRRADGRAATSRPGPRPPTARGVRRPRAQVHGRRRPRAGRGEGTRVRDAAGKEYVDAISAEWVLNLGFRNPEVKQAIVEQLDTIDYVSPVFESAPRTELASRLSELAPGRLSKVLYALSGGGGGGGGAAPGDAGDRRHRLRLPRRRLPRPHLRHDRADLRRPGDGRGLEQRARPLPAAADAGADLQLLPLPAEPRARELRPRLRRVRRLRPAERAHQRARRGHRRALPGQRRHGPGARGLPRARARDRQGPRGAADRRRSPERALPLRADVRHASGPGSSRR